MRKFEPTYLYIKKHAVTGMLYFGKTVRKDPEKYKGSGTYWKNHYKKHGAEAIETKWTQLFESENDLVEFATAFSEIFDIANSPEWANQVIETGISGSPKGKRENDRRVFSEEHKKNLAIARRKRVIPPEFGQKISAIQKGKKRGPYNWKNKS